MAHSDLFLAFILQADMSHSRYMRAELSWFASKNSFSRGTKAVMRQAFYSKVVSLWTSVQRTH